MELKVAISGINAVDNPGPGIGVAKSIKEDKELNAKIIGLAYDAMEPGIYMDWIIDKAYIMPYPSGGYEAYIERLYYIKQTYGLDFVMPVLDAELPIYIKYQQELERNGIKTFLPSLEQFKLRGKDKLEEIAKNIGIDSPKSEVVSSYEELTKAIEKIGLPIMVKGAFYKAYRAYTFQEATSYFNKIVAEWGYPVIVQQVVKGEEMNVVAAGDGEGNSLGMVGIKKMWITELGKIWTGVTIKNKKMLNAAENFIKKYKWKGAFELECIVDIENDKVYLIEINPRFPAWSYFSTGVGVNIASNIIRKAFGLDIDIKDYEAGKLYVRYTDDLITDMDKFQKIIIRGEN
ncbi:ATP-grasp domain-containing protein [Hydrogenothermus marinus]|uniref:Carbamoyl-phosphate synthase large subunit n=1 Tax=Hydrogenothermus marinus TaxID=133270 RepID=A0A3M0BD43_9AQUI|nr:ATP-grasp domain-containing protein [Hydrogenothermus marinus]RMA92475.1 carbamoyl-phosphate synthase large subunit [Hydrogenothermus marinus]